MTDVYVSSEDVIVTVEQPSVPPNIQPPNIGLVEISQAIQRGSMWLTGSGPPTTEGGQIGDMYLDVDTGDIYQWTGTEWDYRGTFAPTTLTPEEILDMMLTVDGAGSGLDADLLDGQHGAYYATKAGLDANSARDDTQDNSIQANTNAITGINTAIDNLQTGTTPAAILAKLITVDGPGSGLDADTLDGHDTAYFATQAGLTAEVTSRTNADTALDAKITTEKNRNDAQDTAIALRLTDAPSDANAYGRKGAAWVDVTEEAPSDGLGYMRKNGVWTPSSGGATTDDLPPAGPLQDGQFWWKSSTGVLYLWYDDGDSQQWVQVSASPQTPPMPTGFWEPIANVSFSAVANYDIVGLAPYWSLRATGHIACSLSSSLCYRTSADNGASFSAGATDYSFQYGLFNVTANTVNQGTGSIGYLSGSTTDAGAAVHFEALFTNFNAVGGDKGVNVSSKLRVNGSVGKSVWGNAINLSPAQNALRFLPIAGGTITGRLIIEGVRG